MPLTAEERKVKLMLRMKDLAECMAEQKKEEDEEKKNRKRTHTKVIIKKHLMLPKNKSNDELKLEENLKSINETISRNKLNCFEKLMPLFKLNCKGDVCKGDIIYFTEAVFGGSFKKPKFAGNRAVIAKILNDSYGEEKQQHTFSLLIIDSCGFDWLNKNCKTRRKGRNIYKNETYRLAWDDENLRELILTDKHERGDAAREQRDFRKSEDNNFY